MKSSMVKYVFGLGFSALLFTSSSVAQDDMMACEIVLIASLDQDAKDDTPAPAMATFMPADKFLFSLLDGKEGHMVDVGGNPIRGVMCKRNNVVPTTFDLKIIRTGIPVHFSQNFDMKTSSLLSIRKNGDFYISEYSGAALDKDDAELLKLRLKELNTKQ